MIDDATVGGVLATRTSALAAAHRVIDDLGPADVAAVVYSFQNRRGQDLMLLTAAPSPVAAPIDALSALVPVVPTARRDFARATRLGAFVRLYQPSASRDAGVLWQLRDARDKTLTTQRKHLPPEAFGRTKSVDLTPTFSLDGLAPGEYVLSLDVTFNRRVTRRHVRFTVMP